MHLPFRPRSQGINADAPVRLANRGGAASYLGIGVGVVPVAVHGFHPRQLLLQRVQPLSLAGVAREHRHEAADGVRPTVSQVGTDGRPSVLQHCARRVQLPQHAHHTDVLLCEGVERRATLAGGGKQR